MSLLRGLKGHYTILLVEHDMDAVFALADRIRCWCTEKVIFTGTPDGIRNHPEVRAVYLGEERPDARGMRASGRLWPGAGAVRHLASTFGAGEVVTLLGRNGMGRSTTIKCLFGMLRRSRRADRLRRAAGGGAAVAPHRAAGAWGWCRKGGRCSRT